MPRGLAPSVPPRDHHRVGTRGAWLLGSRAWALHGQVAVSMAGGLFMWCLRAT